MRFAHRSRVIALSAALLFLASQSLALADATPTVQFNPEVYTKEGQTIGCGISFVAVWIDEEQELIGITGSANIFVMPERKNILALIKATGVINGRTLQEVIKRHPFYYCVGVKKFFEESDINKLRAALRAETEAEIERYQLPIQPSQTPSQRAIYERLKKLTLKK